MKSKQKTSVLHKPKKMVFSRNKSHSSSLFNASTNFKKQLGTLRHNNRDLAQQLSVSQVKSKDLEQKVSILQRTINLQVPKIVIGNLSKMVTQLKSFLQIVQQTMFFCENPDADMDIDGTIINPDMELSSMIPNNITSPSRESLPKETSEDQRPSQPTARRIAKLNIQQPNLNLTPIEEQIERDSLSTGNLGRRSSLLMDNNVTRRTKSRGRNSNNRISEDKSTPSPRQLILDYERQQETDMNKEIYNNKFAQEVSLLNCSVNLDRLPSFVRPISTPRLNILEKDKISISDGSSPALTRGNTIPKTYGSFPVPDTAKIMSNEEDLTLKIPIDMDLTIVNGVVCTGIDVLEKRVDGPQLVINQNKSSEINAAKKKRKIVSENQKPFSQMIGTSLKTGNTKPLNISSGMSHVDNNDGDTETIHFPANPTRISLNSQGSNRRVSFQLQEASNTVEDEQNSDNSWLPECDSNEKVENCFDKEKVRRSPRSSNLNNGEGQATKVKRSLNRKMSAQSKLLKEIDEMFSSSSDSSENPTPPTSPVSKGESQDDSKSENSSNSESASNISNNENKTENKKLLRKRSKISIGPKTISSNSPLSHSPTPTLSVNSVNNNLRALSPSKSKDLKSLSSEASSKPSVSGVNIQNKRIRKLVTRISYSTDSDSDTDSDYVVEKKKKGTNPRHSSDRYQYLSSTRGQKTNQDCKYLIKKSKPKVNSIQSDSTQLPNVKDQDLLVNSVVCESKTKEKNVMEKSKNSSENISTRTNGNFGSTNNLIPNPTKARKSKTATKNLNKDKATVAHTKLQNNSLPEMCESSDSNLSSGNKHMKNKSGDIQLETHANFDDSSNDSINNEKLVLNPKGSEKEKINPNVKSINSKAKTIVSKYKKKVSSATKASNSKKNILQNNKNSENVNKEISEETVDKVDKTSEHPVMMRKRLSRVPKVEPVTPVQKSPDNQHPSLRRKSSLHPDPAKVKRESLNFHMTEKESPKRSSGNLVDGKQVGRRARAQVSYKELSIHAKMRRPE